MKKEIIASSFLFISAAVHGLWAQNVQLEPMTTFGVNGNGSIMAGERYYVTASNLERGMAFNPVTGHLLLVHREPSANSFTVHILDGTTGDELGMMSVDLQYAGHADFLLNQIGVAEDGAIYVSNLATSSANYRTFLLYRAADESSTLTYVYGGDPSNGDPNSINWRWGDTMAVRGAGINTEVLLATQSGTMAAILKPTDASMTWFAANTLATDAPAGGIGYGITFGGGNTFWAKGASTAGNPLFHFSYDLGAGTATTLHTYSTTDFPGRVGPMRMNVPDNLLAAIEPTAGTATDQVRLYDLAALPDAPYFLDRQDVAHWTNANNILAGAVAFGTNSSGQPTLYALNNNNGIMAFGLVASNHLVAPFVFQSPPNVLAIAGSNLTFTVGADGIPDPAYQWFYNETNIVADATNASFTIRNLDVADAGNYSVVVTNLLGAATSSLSRLTVITDPTDPLLFYEPFAYTAGERLSEVNADWTLNGSTTNDTYVLAESLAVSGLAVAQGGSITHGGAGAAVRHPVNPAIINGSLYYSFAMRIDEVGDEFTSTTSFIAAFLDTASVYQARLMPRASLVAPGQYNLGWTKFTSSQGVWAPEEFLEGETVFVVARYTFNTGSTTDDEAALWINPEPATFGDESPPAPALIATLTGTDISAIAQFTFRQNNAGNTPAAVTYDELRIGRTWQSVTPLPTVPRPILTAALSGGDVVLAWPIDGSDGFVLESIGDFDDPGGWQPMAEPVVVQGPNNTVTVGGTDGRRFFRLVK